MKVKLDLTEREKADLYTVLEDVEYRLFCVSSDIEKGEATGANLCDVASMLNLLGKFLMDREKWVD
ncbi:TPA: hypothetical protein P6383_004972 [Escherichia coli]|nr:hypothetical protein [Escherichia coli]